MIASSKPRALIYARFSPRSRSSECLSCDVQIADLRERADQLGYEWAEERIFRDDALSGKSLMKRQGFAAMMSAVRRGDVVMVRDYKRLARKALDAFALAARLNKKGVRLYTLEDGEYDPADTGKLIAFGVKAILAEVERIESARRTKTKMLRYQANGRAMGRIPPYGTKFDVEGPKHAISGRATRLIDEPTELAMIAKIVDLRLDGDGARAIAKRLNSEGLTCRGKPWKHQTIAKILKREATATET